ncbi:MAG: PorT family protein [Saprospiraceae bacterium]|nr:PorT family protein [Saprospiraceae bacterium]
MNYQAQLRFFFFLLVSLTFWQNMAAQPRFRAGAVAGLTASQIDGDLSAGYNKLGLTAGLRVVGRLKEKTEASLEFLFSQRGCQNELIQGDFDQYPFSLRLNYVEVPIQWHYKDWLIEGDDEKDNFYRVSFNAGLSYSRLINAKVDDDNSWLSGVAPDFLKKNDFGFCLGFNFFANRHLGFTFRFYRSVMFMYNPKDWNPAPAQRGWNLHCLNFQAVYLL